MKVSLFLQLIFGIFLFLVCKHFVGSVQDRLFGTPYLLDILHISSALLIVLGVLLLITSIYILLNKNSKFNLGIAGYRCFHQKASIVPARYPYTASGSSDWRVYYFRFSKIFVFFLCFFSGSALAAVGLNILMHTLPSHVTGLSFLVSSVTAKSDGGVGLISLILTALAVVMAFVTSGVVSVSKNAVNDTKDAIAKITHANAEIDDAVTKTKLQHAAFIVDRQRLFIGLHYLNNNVHDAKALCGNASDRVNKYYEYFHGYLAFIPLSASLLNMHLNKIDDYSDVLYVHMKDSEIALIENIILLLDIMIKSRLDFEEKNISQTHLGELLLMHSKYCAVMKEIGETFKQNISASNKLRDSKQTPSKSLSKWGLLLNKIGKVRFFTSK